jgi:hypothetical protein
MLKESPILVTVWNYERTSGFSKAHLPDQDFFKRGYKRSQAQANCSLQRIIYARSPVHRVMDARIAGKHKASNYMQGGCLRQARRTTPTRCFSALTAGEDDAVYVYACAEADESVYVDSISTNVAKMCSAFAPVSTSRAQACDCY